MVKSVNKVYTKIVTSLNDFLNLKIHGSNLDVTELLPKFKLNKSDLGEEHSIGKFRFNRPQSMKNVVGRKLNTHNCGKITCCKLWTASHWYS